MTTTKNKHATSKSHFKKWQLLTIMGFVILLALGLGLYSRRAWVERVYYGYKARTSYQAEAKKLNSPSGVLGLSNKSLPSKCLYESTYDYVSPQLQCVVEFQNYVVIGDNAQSQAAAVGAAKTLDAVLKKDGWTTTSNSAASLSEWFQGITSGKDYSTDIDSVMNSKSTHCSLVYNVAYSNPKPPAFEVRMACASPILQKVKNEALL
jgi:hypothetical protein